MLGLLNISHLLSNNNQKWLQMPYCLKQSSLREFPKKRFGTTVGLSMDMKMNVKLARLKHSWQARIK